MTLLSVSGNLTEYNGRSLPLQVILCPLDIRLGHLWVKLSARLKPVTVNRSSSPRLCSSSPTSCCWWRCWCTPPPCSGGFPQRRSCSRTSPSSWRSWIGATTAPSLWPNAWRPLDCGPQTGTLRDQTLTTKHWCSLSFLLFLLLTRTKEES